MVNFFFAGWEPVGRILVVGTLAYAALVLLLRVSGKRTLAQMNSFDFIITVAIGATFGRIMTARSVALVEAVTAFGLLIGLQYVVTSLQIRSRSFARAVTTAPTLLAYRGEVLDDALRQQRLTADELHAAVRKHGFGSLEEIGSVVLEADGRLAIIGDGKQGDGSALADVPPPEPS